METEEPKTFLGTDRYLHHTFIRSETLAYCKYDTIHSLLLVIFHNGSNYEYHGVDQTTYDELVGADSPGRYFSSFIRNKYRCERIK